MISLLPHQTDHAEHLYGVLRDHGACLDASDTGTGKSYVAAHLADRLTTHPDQVLVLCPKAVVTMWQRLLPQANVLNYESAIRPNRGLFNAWGGRGGKTPKGAHKHAFLIVDEAHRTSNWNTKTSALVRALAKEADYTMLLSATVADNPLSLRPAHQILDFHVLDFYPWARRRGCFQVTMGLNKFWQFTENEDKRQAAMLDVHLDLFPKYGGRMRSDEISGYPGETRTAIAYDLAPADHRKLVAALADTGEDHMSQRMEVELAKVPLFVDLAKAELDQSRKVIAFFNFREPQAEFARRMNCPSVHGGQTPAARDEAIEHFQDHGAPCIAVNIQSGGAGISLHDYKGDGQRVSLVSPPYSSKDLLQVFGRSRRTGSHTDPIHKLVYAANTIEERVCEHVSAKLGDLSTLNDGTLDFNKQ